MAPKASKTKRSVESTKKKALKAPKDMLPENSEEIKDELVEGNEKSETNNAPIENVTALLEEFNNGSEIEPKRNGRRNQPKKAEFDDVKENGEVMVEPVVSKKRNIATKVEMDKGDSKDEKPGKNPKTKPVIGKRGQKKVTETDEEQVQEESTSKRRRKAEEKALIEEADSKEANLKSGKKTKKSGAKKPLKKNTTDHTEEVTEIIEEPEKDEELIMENTESTLKSSEETNNELELEPEKKGRKNQSKKAANDEVKENSEEEPSASKKKKVTKKDKDDIKEVPEDIKVKPAKDKGGQKGDVDTAAIDNEQEEPTSKRKRKAEDKAMEDKLEAAPKPEKKAKKIVTKPLQESISQNSEKKIHEEEHAKSEKNTSDSGETDEKTVKEPKKKERKIQSRRLESGDVKKEPEAPKDKKKTPVEKEALDVDAKAKPVKGKRGQKKVVTAEEDEKQQEESASKRRKAEEKAPAEQKKKAPPKNKATTNYEALDFSNNAKNTHGKEWNFKIASWNVDGIRAWLSKGGLDYIKYERPDILCLQETKCSQDKLPGEITNLPGYHAYWICSEKDGYAGVGIYTTKLAMNVQYGLQNEELDSEGRIITAEYEQFYLICTYVPNAGRKLVTLPKRLQWNKEFRNYVKELDKKKPVIICGDMNVAHEEIDLANPKGNKKNAGFTAEERADMTELLGDGFVDTFRHFYPDKSDAYTFWTYMMNSRAKNVGWRLDYFLVSERLLPLLCDNQIRDQVYGSDHCPISLFLHLTSADKPKE